jgi:tetratricopeptide (TPR) repeat protein
MKYASWKKILAFYDKSLAIRLKFLGPDHPDTATTYFNLGWLCYNMEDYTESLKHLELALAIKLKSFDPGHPSISNVKSWIAAVKKKM